MNLLIVLVICTLNLNLASAKSHNNCNDDCLTKTYCLSSDGSNVCSKNNQLTAKWFVVRQEQGEDIVGLTLNGQGIKPTDEKTISLTFQTSNKSSQAKTIYSCYKSPLGGTSAQVEVDYYTTSTIDKGSSYYSNNVLSCSWSFTRTDEIYPLYYESATLMTDSNYQIVLQYGAEATGTIVATDTSGLPIYHLQYLKCCYKVHGNNDYLMISNQTNHNQYLVQTMYNYPSITKISLRDVNGIELLFICNTLKQFVQGSMKNGSNTWSISDQIYGMYTSRYQCLWSHPLSLLSSSGPYDTTNGIYDLQITADNVVVYTEKGVTLRNSASKLLTLTSMVLVIISLLLNCFV